MKLFDKKVWQEFFAVPINNRKDLFEIIKKAADANVFDKDSLPLIEAVLQFGDMRAKDILLPRHEVDIIDLSNPIEDIITLIVNTGHSRFPVIDGDVNDIVGIFHSKDIVGYITNPEEFDLRALLRQPMFIPDMKPLDSLLYEMRVKHSHMAIVVDEFTNISGIVTLEMIVEQIVGEIDDEHDSIDGEHAIVELSNGIFRIKGHCGLEQFNSMSGLNWSDSKVESVGGFISKKLGRIPQTNEKSLVEGCQIDIVNADSRKINTVIVNIMPNK